MVITGSSSMFHATGLEIPVTLGVETPVSDLPEKLAVDQRTLNAPEESSKRTRDNLFVFLN